MTMVWVVRRASVGSKEEGAAHSPPSGRGAAADVIDTCPVSDRTYNFGAGAGAAGNGFGTGAGWLRSAGAMPWASAEK